MNPISPPPLVLERCLARLSLRRRRQINAIDETALQRCSHDGCELFHRVGSLVSGVKVLRFRFYVRGCEPNVKRKTQTLNVRRETPNVVAALSPASTDQSALVSYCDAITGINRDVAALLI